MVDGQVLGHGHCREPGSRRKGGHATKPRRNGDGCKTTFVRALATLPAMALNSHPTYSAASSYVLKLHPNSRPDQGHLTGRLEHMVSGYRIDFISCEMMIDWLKIHAFQAQAGTKDPA